MTIIGEYRNDSFEMSHDNNDRCDIYARLITPLEQSRTTDRMRAIWQTIPVSNVESVIRSMISQREKWSTSMLQATAFNQFITQNSRFKLHRSIMVYNSEIENNIFITFEIGEK